MRFPIIRPNTEIPVPSMFQLTLDRIPAVPAPVLPLVPVPATAQLPETLPLDVPLETDGLQTAGNGKAALRSATYSHCWLFYWELSY